MTIFINDKKREAKIKQKLEETLVELFKDQIGKFETIQIQDLTESIKGIISNRSLYSSKIKHLKAQELQINPENPNEIQVLKYESQPLKKGTILIESNLKGLNVKAKLYETKQISIPYNLM